MNDPSFVDVQTEIVRLQRVIAETLERYANRTSEERTDALVEALRSPIGALSVPTRQKLVAALGELYGTATPAGVSARLAQLEAENRRLKAALEARPTIGATPANDPRLAAALLDAFGLGGPSGELVLGDPELERRLVGVLRPLVAFLSELVRSYLGATLDPDHTMGGRLSSLLAEELDGSVPAGSVAAMIGQIRQQIGAQLMAFREACDSGVRDLLRQLAPPALAAGAGEGSVRVLGKRPFYYRECWENFERKYEELRTADSLYESYFDGAFRKALHRASRSVDATRGGVKMPESSSR